MTSNAPERVDIETEIAALEEALRQRRFYMRLLGLWLILSLGLTIAFGWVVISGFKSFPREAQYACLGIAFTSLLITGTILKWQQDAIFRSERDLRHWRTLQRSRGTGQASGVNAVRERHRAEAWDLIEQERMKASRNRRFHRFSQSVVMLGSILVTALTGAMAPDNPTNWVVVTISIAVAGAAGFGTIFRWRELSFSQQQTANEIEKQLNHLELRIYDYAEEGIDAMQLFAERVEALKEEQRNRELQLEHSPERNATDHGVLGQQPQQGV